MTITVSRGTAYTSDGRKLCSRCARRPAKPGQRYCRPCHAEYMRDWRAAQPKKPPSDHVVHVALTRSEWEEVQRARAAGWPVGGLTSVQP